MVHSRSAVCMTNAITLHHHSRHHKLFFKKTYKRSQRDHIMGKAPVMYIVNLGLNSDSTVISTRRVGYDPKQSNK